MIKLMLLIFGGLLLGITGLLLQTRRQSPQEWVVFYVECEADVLRSSNLYRMHPDGTALEQLTHLNGFTLDPVWTVDGRWLYFSATETGQAMLYRMRPDGQDLTALVPLSSILNATPGTLIPLPDGRALLHKRVDQDKDVFFLSFPDGSLARPLLPSDYLFSREWSPDRRLIAYTSIVDNVSNIWLMEANGHNPRQVTFTTGGSWNPTWSPDGQWLAFNAWNAESKHHELYKIRPDGTDLTLMLTQLCSMAQPAWSPKVEFPWQPVQVLAAGVACLALVGLFLFVGRVKAEQGIA